MFRSVGRRLVSSLVIGLFFLSTTIASSTAAYAGDDDELEKILQQGLKEIDGDAKDKKPEPKKEAKKEEKKPEAKPVEAKKEPIKPVETAPVEPKPEPVQETKRAPVAPLKSAEPVVEEPAATVEPTQQPTTPSPASPTTSTSATTAKPIEVSEKAAPAAGAATDPAAAKKKKNQVSMAVNADQAALSGAASKAWSVVLNLSTGVGSGTMMTGGSDYAKNAYVGQQLLIEPAYVFKLTDKIRLRLSVREVFDWEFTRVDNNSAQYFNWSDIVVGASSRLAQIPVVGIDVFAAFRMPAPISRQSQHQTLVTAIMPAVGLAKNFDIPVRGDYHMNLNIRYDFGYRKNFHRFITPLIAAENTEAQPLAIRSATDPFIDGNMARGGATNVEHTFSNALTLSFTPQDMVTLSVFAQLVNGVKYAGQQQLVADQYTSEYARLGAGRLETIRSNIDLTISPTSYLWVSVGIFTAQPVFAPDNKTVYNPIWNQSSAANNYSQLYFSVGGQI